MVKKVTTSESGASSQRDILAHHDTLAQRDILERLAAIAIEAGDAILHLRRSGKLSPQNKEDGSPVTLADQTAERIIRQRIQEWGNQDPIVGEEEGYEEAAKLARRFWMIDPLDGTKGFIKGQDYFTVNIALIEDSRPILGIVHAPVFDQCYAASKPCGAWIKKSQGDFSPIHVRGESDRGLKILISTSSQEKTVREMLDPIPIDSIESISSSIKFCRIAEGSEDLYIRMGPTHEWDTAAGQAVLEIAGGVTTHLDGKDFLYGKEKFLNPHFIAAARRSIVESIIRG